MSEQKEGKWMTTDAYPHHLYCSVCYLTYCKNMRWVVELKLPVSYCPSCGARMSNAEDMVAYIADYMKE